MLGDLFEGCLHIDPMAQTADVLVESPQPVPTCKGVVLFADPQGWCISMLTAANVRRTVSARLFGPPAEKGGKRGSIAPLVRTVYYECCHNDFAAALKYLQAARVLWPQSWRSMMALPQLWFVRIDLNTAWPNFAATEKITSSAGQHVFGPFPTRKAASRYVTSLRTAFALCHRPDLVDSPEKAATCPYLQMGTCPAPCVGNMSREGYRRELERAVAAAGGRLSGVADDLRRRMMAMAAEQQFEQAAAIKKRIEALDALGSRDYVWTHELSDLALLHIDRWVRVTASGGGRRKVQTYAGYLIVDGTIHRLDAFAADQAEALCREAAHVLEAHITANESELAKDNLALAASFIYRSNPPGIWIDCSAREGRYVLLQPEDIAARIRTRFGKDAAPEEPDESPAT